MVVWKNVFQGKLCLFEFNSAWEEEMCDINRHRKNRKLFFVCIVLIT